LSMIGVALGARPAPGADYCFDHRVSQGSASTRCALVAPSATLAKCGPTPAFVCTRVFAADGSELRVANGIGLFANSEISGVWALVDVAPGGQGDADAGECGGPGDENDGPGAWREQMLGLQTHQRVRRACRHEASDGRREAE
jgi:hypothetical protein